MSQQNIPERFQQRIQAAKEQHLEVLDLSNNLFADDSQKSTQIPDEVFELTHLEKLDLSNNQLTNFPDSLTNLSNLTELNLRRNQLTNLPESLGNLSNLTILDLKENRLDRLPNSLGNLSKLQKLYLNTNRLFILPDSLGRIFNLVVLYLSNNQLFSLPNCFDNRSELTELYLNGNQLSNLPESFVNLSKLEILDLTANQLFNLPESFAKLVNLAGLNLDNNQLSNLPESLANLSKLKLLYLANNQLSNLPESFAKLLNLTALDLSNNQLKDIPKFIAKLSNLTTLSLSANQIPKIPLWLAEHKLKIKIENDCLLNGINLFNNPIEEPPLEVVKQGNESILNYYSQIAIQGKDYLYEAKLLIVGEGGAGKTTLAHKIQDTNCPLPYIDDRTKGITINTHSFSVSSNKSTSNRSFQLNIWDFGGQEIYHATHRFFLSRRSLYVLVADNREDNTDFNYWLNIIELFAGDIPILIVLNEKNDLQRILNTSELRSRYSNNLKELISVNFKTYEEPDSDKRQQRLKIIHQLISHIEHHASHLPHIGEPVPALWVNIRQAVENNSCNYIYFNEFVQICHDQGLTNNPDIVTLLAYFHDLGILLHFADQPLLRDRVILKPAWATNAVYRIFDNDLIKAKQGRFTRTDCSALWNDDQYKYMQDVLITLMKKFLLVYEIGNSGNLIAPQMLPQDTPNYDWNDNNNSLMQFRYDLFMPQGILWQFIVTMYRYIKNHSWVWRNGVILERDGTSAEVSENLFERRIYLRFNGNSINEFRAIIADRLDEISQSYHKLKYEKMVPCSCSSCLHSSEPHFFKFSTLKKRQTQRTKHTIECEISGKDVPLSLLLEGFETSHISEELPESSSQDRTQPNTPTTIMHFHGNVGTATGMVDGNQNLEDVNVEGNSTDQSRTQNIKAETINAEGAAAFGLGDLSGTVANTLNQLPSFDNEPHKKELKELLTQLQTAVLDTDLDTEEQEESLEQINAIAIALQNPQDGAVKKSVKKAMKGLGGTAFTLPSDSSMVDICNQLPDLIGKVFYFF